MSNTLWVAEIGINHNGNIDVAKRLIDLAKKHGFDYVKFQKRDIDSCYTQEYLDSPRQSPWGTTQREQKKGLEFSIEQYKEIDAYCKSIGMKWYYSPWDVKSAEQMRIFDCDYVKIAKACITNKELFKWYAENKSSQKMIVSINLLDNRFLPDGCLYGNIKFMLNCISLYPSPIDFNGLEEKNFAEIRRYGYNPGYSNHSSHWIYPVIASFMGAEMIEVHITLDKNAYGSDQAASLDDDDLFNMMLYKYRELPQNEIDNYLIQEAEVLKKLRQTW